MHIQPHLGNYSFTGRKSFILPFLTLLLMQNSCGSVHEPFPKKIMDLNAVPLCYEHGCAVQTSFQLSAKQWEHIKSLFSPPAKEPAFEREQIRRAVALLEDIAGQQTPTHRDRGRNPWFTQPTPGAMDCVDESINSMTYLIIFKQRNLLRWHEVLSRVYRAPHLFDLHYAARIKDISTGQEYVVDSWFLDNGEKPYIQKLNDWFNKKPFSVQTEP